MSLEQKTLIHTALLCEATPFIQELKLIKLTKHIYENDKYLLIVSGIGKHNTIKNLNEIFQNFHIVKAINIGIAGCNDKTIKIGELFCVTNNTTIQNATIKSYEVAIGNCEDIETTLVDMEFEYFYKLCSDFQVPTIYSFKVVSDYCENQIPKKEFVTKLIYENMHKIKGYL